MIITNFITEVNDSNIDVVISSINDVQVEVLAISDCVEHSSQFDSSQFSQNPFQPTAQTKSQKMFTEMMKEVDGYLCHIDLAESQLLVFQKKKSKPMPWNADLTIGTKMKIAISGYVSVQEEKFLASFKTQCAMPNTFTKMVTEYSQNNQPISKPDEEDIIKSYMYGSTLVPLGEDVSVKNTERCLSCLGFTKRNKIASEFFAGTGSHVVVARKDCSKAAMLFASLVENMKDGNYAMIARKVYNKGSRPIVVALLPHVVDKVPSLTMIQLPFGNDISSFSFPRLTVKKTEATKEQKEKIKELVNSMDLMNAIDDDSGLTEAFAIQTSLNPVHQHMCRSVSYRALHPMEPLPTIDPELIAMIEVPPKIKQQSEDVVKEIETLFPLELVERKVKKVFGLTTADSLADDVMDVDDTSDLDTGKLIIAVGTVTPAEDFLYLLKKGERFTVIAEQLQTVIHDLIFRTASLQLEKILECLVTYREESKKFGPFSYNSWIKELKKAIVQRNRLEFWQDSIVKEGLGLITVNEAAISTVTIEEQLEFYEVSSKESHQAVAMDGDDDDLDNYL